ncbi:MAG: VWA domain-containing protein [Polyangiaceae bacterium]|nr:VWA domain-containing protein [Polyangiaceae bacterium]
MSGIARCAVVALACAAAIAVGCGDTGGTGSGGFGGAGNSGGSSTSGMGATGGTSNVGGLFGGATGTGTGTGGIQECASETQQGTFTPVDLVIMLDQSGSMAGEVGNTTVWALVTDALKTFVQAPDAAGLSVGLQYFPLPDGACTSCADCFLPDLQITDTSTNTCCCSPPTGQSCALADGAACPGGGICFQGQCYSGGANATCNKAEYADLEVPVSVLPGNASALVNSLTMHAPKGLTPTAPALSGAIDAAIARAQAAPDHTVAVVLASDGVPTECAPQDISQISMLAATAAAGNPKVLTYVIGIGDVAALNTIAQAGGTTKAFLVSTNGNAGQQFLDAMKKIQGSLLACEFDIPQPSQGELDYELVNVQITPEGGAPEIVPQVANVGACGSGAGWYYDNPASPQKIILCDATCELVKASNKAGIDIVFGCQTIVK